MQTNPFIESVVNRIAGISSAIVAWIVFSVLLYFYGGADWEIAFLDSFVSIGLLAIAGFLYGYIAGTNLTFQVKALLLVLIVGISLAGAFELRVLVIQEIFADFAMSIPLRVVFSVLCWIILLQWFRMNRIDADVTDEVVEREEKTNEETSATPEPMLDRVSVKDGSRIHIIHLDELLYLQAGGDYVTLFTPTGQYVKEQTMKYFELHLPPVQFVRIHRSCIVNAEQILRVELFGKENYQVRLKNGVCLRASSAGYKLLKERLSL